MISESLLKLLACPKTKRELRVGTPQETELVNNKIQAAELLSLSGKPVNEAVEQILIEMVDGLAYPVRNDIPVLIESEAFKLPH